MSDEASRPGGPGAALLTERRRQNLSLGDVSRQLKLSVRQVEALERDDFSGFQGPVFIHGFLRNYAKLLGLDPAPLIRAADNLLKPAAAAVEADNAVAPVAMPAGSGEKPRWPMFAGIAAVVVVAGLLAMNSRSPTTSKPRPVPEPTTAVATSQGAERRPQGGKVPDKPVAEKPTTEKGLPEKTSPDRHAMDRPVEPKPVAEKPVTEKPAQVVPADGTAQAAVASVPADPNAPRMVVRMIFEQDSWVEIKDRNGNTVFGQLNAAGTSRRASGEPPLTVVVGNAAGVRLFQGDKSIDLAPHTRVDVARLILE